MSSLFLQVNQFWKHPKPYLEVKLFKVADALTFEIVDLGALAALAIIISELGLGRIARHVHAEVGHVLPGVHAEAVQLVVAHVEAGLAGGRAAQLPSLLRVLGRVAPLLEAVARVLGTLERAHGDVDH